MRVAGYRIERALQRDGAGQGARAWARRVHDRDVGRRKLPRGARLILRLCVCVREGERENERERERVCVCVFCVERAVAH